MGLFWAPAAHADPPGETAVVQEGEAAPFEGVLLDNERALWMLEAAQERDVYRDKSDALELANVELSQANQELRKHVEEMANRPAAGPAFGAGVGIGAGVALAVVLSVVLGSGS